MIYYYGQRIIVILEVQYYENVLFIFCTQIMVCKTEIFLWKFCFSFKQYRYVFHKMISIKTIQVVGISSVFLIKIKVLYL